MRKQGLGTIGSAANGITISTTTNATPIVATFNTGHGLKDLDRVVVTGITGNTGANGEWSIKFTGAATAQLLGSVGNGTHGGSPVVAVIMDVTPFRYGRRAVGFLHERTNTAVPVATCLIESSDDNSSFADARSSGEEAIAANTGTNSYCSMLDVFLKRYMRFRASAWTSGGAQAELLSW